MRRAASGVALLVLASGCGPVVVWHGRSPDRARRVVVMEEEGRQRLVIDEVPGADFDAVGFTHLRWSAGGPVVPVQVDGRWHVAVGGELGAGHDAIGEVVVSGARVAYQALDEDGWRVFVDGAPGPAFESLVAGSLAFGGGRLVYVGRDAQGAHVVDGEVGPPFLRVASLGFGAKGTMVGYVGVHGDGAMVVIEGRTVLRAEAISALVLASGEPRWAAIVDDEVVHGEARYPAPSARGLTISGDGAHVAWSVERGDEVEVFVDGHRVGVHLAVERMRFVPRTNALLYVARESDGVHVVHDGVVGPRVASVEALVTSEAGHVGYVARRGVGCAVVIDDELRHRGEWAGGLTLAARSGRWAFLIREAGRRYLITPDARVELERPFVDTLVLDSEGARWAIALADRNERRLDVVVDGQRVAPLDVDEVSAALLQGRDPIEVVREIVAGELARAR